MSGSDQEFSKIIRIVHEESLKIKNSKTKMKIEESANKNETSSSIKEAISLP